MELLQAVKERHSVRQYLDKPIETDKVAELKIFIDESNKSGNLHFQLVLNEPKAFDSFMAHYGKFSGVKNYVALVGKKGGTTEETIGYYGAKLILFAQTLGLNTCWVALTYKKVKTAFTTETDEKLYSLIALGYGKTQGVQHKSKSAAEVSSSNCAEKSEWFENGVKTALLAPTAVNRQKFHFTLNADNSVSANTKGGFYTKMDLGIARYFFELGAGDDHVNWKE